LGNAAKGKKKKKKKKRNPGSWPCTQRGESSGSSEYLEKIPSENHDLPAEEKWSRRGRTSFGVGSGSGGFQNNPNRKSGPFHGELQARGGKRTEPEGSGRIKPQIIKDPPSARIDRGTPLGLRARGGRTLEEKGGGRKFNTQ